MSSESLIGVLETLFLFAVEAMDERDCGAYTKNVLLAMDPFLDNCPIILLSVTFELFLHYLVTKKKKGGGLLSVQTYDGCHSPLMQIYCWSNYTCFDHFCNQMSNFICAMRRKVCFV